MKRLQAAGKVLRFAGEIKDGRCHVGPVEVSLTDPLAQVRGGENVFVFTTRRYSPIPLVIRGYGAGSEVTAAGVFADILRTVSFNPRV
jgi:aspartokinase/homoserine dehydrogenase 1